MNKHKYYRTSALKVPSMIWERLLSRVSYYLIAITVLLLFGLINKDGPWRGFPVPWIFNIRHVMGRYFVQSLLVTALVVVGTDIIAHLIIQIKEPKLVVHTRAPKAGVSTDETIEMSEIAAPVESENAAAERRMSRRAEQPATDKRARESTENRPDKKNKKGSGAGFVIFLVAATIILSVFPVFDSFTDDDGFDDLDVWDYEAMLYTDIDSAAVGTCDGFFEVLGYYDTDPIADMLSESESSEIRALTDWNGLEYFLIYSYIDEEDNFALSKYIVTDNNGDTHIVAVYMQFEDDGESAYKGKIKGLAFCPNVTGLSDDDHYTNNILIDHAKDILQNQTVYGVTKIGGVSILIWDPNTDIFGRSKT